MALKQIQAFQTTDGQVHESKLKGLMHEREIEIRGIIQSGPDGIPLKNGVLTMGDAIKIITQNIETLSVRLRWYRDAIKRERERGQKVSVQPLA